MKKININYYQWRRQGEGGSFHLPRKPGKFAKDGEQLTPQQAMRIDSKRKFRVSSNFPIFVLKFS